MPWTLTSIVLYWLFFSRCNVITGQSKLGWLVLVFVLMWGWIHYDNKRFNHNLSTCFSACDAGGHLYLCSGPWLGRSRRLLDLKQDSCEMSGWWGPSGGRTVPGCSPTLAASRTRRKSWLLWTGVNEVFHFLHIALLKMWFRVHGNRRWLGPGGHHLWCVTVCVRDSDGTVTAEPIYYYLIIKSITNLVMKKLHSLYFKCSCTQW